MRVAWALMVMLSIAFGSERANANPVETLTASIATASDRLVTTPSASFPIVQLSAWVVRPGLTQLDRKAAQPGRDRPTAEERSDRLSTMSARLTRALVDLAAHPSAALFKTAAERLSATPSARKQNTDQATPFAVVHTTLATVSRRAHEHRVRHFLIHDWPGPGVIAHSGLKLGTSDMSEARVYQAALISTDDAFEITGLSDLEGTPLLEQDWGSWEHTGLADQLSFGDMACELTGRGDQECSDVSDVLGRLPSQAGPLALSAAGAAFLGSQSYGSGGPASQGGGAGSSPAGAALGIAPSLIDFSGGSGDGDGFGLPQPANGTNAPPPGSTTPPSPSVVPLPVGIPLALTGLAALAILRRMKSAA